MDDDIRALQDGLRFLLQQNLPKKHNWNSLESYLYLHETRPLQTGFVRHFRLSWTDPLQLLPDREYYFITCSGTLICRSSVRIKVEKLALIDASNRRHRRVRTIKYAYHAFWHGGMPMLRKDNSDDFLEHHQHRFDLQTGDEIAREPCEWPLLHEFIVEVAKLVGTT